MDDIAEELHKQTKRPTKYRKVKCFAVNSIWSMDLVDMQGFHDTNKDYKYILTCIDLFSRYAWGEKLKTKSGPEVAKAIVNLFKRALAKPNKIWVDQGGEFYNKDVEKILGNIKLYSTYGKAKACIIERFNRTFKNMMYKQFTKNSNHEWLNILQPLMKEYNNKYHRMIKATPAEIYDGENVIEPPESDEKNKHKNKFKIGDHVRISYDKKVFDKSYLPNWTAEIYTIETIKKTNPWMYKIKDHENNIIKRSFYESELQKTKNKDVFLVEEILKKKKTGGRTMYLVKWVGYEKPTWEPKENIQNKT